MTEKPDNTAKTSVPNPSRQPYLTIAESCDHVKGLTGQRRRPSTNAMWRWMRQGLMARNGQRVRLRHVRLGGKLYTRADWIEQWLTELSQADAEHFDRQAERPRLATTFKPAPTNTSEHQRARERLAARGLL